MHTQHATVIIIRGLPGSGKSYIAARLKEILGQNCILLDPDATDYQSEEYASHVKAQTLDGVDPKLHAYRFLRTQAYDGIKNQQIVIWNQPFTNAEIFQKMVANLRKQADINSVELSLLVIEVEIDPLVAKKRIDTRKEMGGHGPSDATFTRFVGDYVTFADLGCTTVIVQGDDNVEHSIEKIVAAIQAG